VPVGELDIAFRQFGAGPDLLLIAGQASAMNTWPIATLTELAEDHRVTIYDSRDLGSTTDTTGAFTLADLADDADGHPDHFHEIVTSFFDDQDQA
jgi:hypothetical protein